jgi:phosphomethylpyrimidine synthase
VRLGEKAKKIDLEISRARVKLDWETQHKLSVNPEKARQVRLRVKPRSGACTMCGEYCVYKVLREKREA